MFFCFFFVFFLSVFAVLQNIQNIQKTELPVVIWHGLGDSYNSEGMQEIIDILSELLNTYVHSVYLDEYSLNDKNGGFFGNVNDQVINEYY